MAHENDWVTAKRWDPKTWSGLSSPNGIDIWTDGTNIYYSNGYNQYVLDKITGTWSTKTWSGLTSFNGQYIWTDGTNIYYSYERTQYVLDKTTGAWSTKTWTGLRNFYGSFVWKSETGGIYYSNASDQYVLNKSENKWVKKTWSGVSRPGGIYIWTDGVNTYYSKTTAQYVLNPATSTWSKKRWTGLTNFYGQYIWSNGDDIYYSKGSEQYVLDKETYTWIPKTWLGLTSFNGQYVWTYDDNSMYYSYGSDQYELCYRIPYRLNFPELIESTDLRDKWVANVLGSTKDKWENETWSGYSPYDGGNVWTDGTNVYYSARWTSQYVLNKSTKTWKFKIWNGLTDFSGRDIWTDGNDIYYSSYLSGKQYVLNKSTETWESKTWSGFADFSGEYVWTDGDNVYCSFAGSSYSYQYVLDKSTATWIAKTWSGLTSFNGNDIWTDGTDIYYSSGSSQYVLDKSTSTWSTKTWSGLTNFNAADIWTDGENIYYSYNSAHYVLDKSTSTWLPKTWYGFTGIRGLYVWSDGENTYFSDDYRSQQYILASRNVTDIPYRMDFPELKESFDLNGSWVTYKIPDPSTAGLRFLKLSYNLTVNWAGGGTNNITVSTDIPEAFKRSDHLWIYSGMSYRQVAMVINTEIPQCPYQCGMTFDSAANDLLETLDFIAPQFYIYRASGASRLAAFTPSNVDTALYAESAKNTALADDRKYLSTPYNYACEPRVTFNFGSGGSFPNESGSTIVTIDIIFAFTADQDDRYADLLARYPAHVTPFEYVKNAVPYRLNFPPLIPSIDPDSWLIDDDIPFRLDFPPLIPSEVPSDAWLQDKGWDPRRPWPDHRSIIQKVQTIPNIPDVDWTKSMQQTFEFYTVDPNNWYDDQKLENIISCDLTHDLTSDKRGNASITVSESLPECYIRTYLVVTQAGYMHKICLGTYLYMTSSDSFDGMKHNITMTGYTPMVELEEKLPPLGFHIVGITNRKHSSDAPMVTDAIKDIVTTYTRCEIENRTVIQKPLLNDFVAGTNDNFLTVINNILNASSLQQYILTVDEWGTIIVKDKPVLEDAIPTYIYTDDNSSILLPSLDTNDDIYGIPNVVEVLYTGDKRLPAIRVIVKNEDPTSIVSIPARGREIAKRFTITNIAAPVNDYSEAAVRAQVTAQAERLLEAASTINKTISYSHGYCDVKVGDTVLINYERAGVTGIRAKVVSQRISCKPGCQVDEQAVYTKKLWNRGV